MKSQKIDELLKTPPLTANRGFSVDVSGLISQRIRITRYAFFGAVFLYLVTGFLIYSAEGNVFYSINSLAEWMGALPINMLGVITTAFGSAGGASNGGISLFMVLPVLIFVVVIDAFINE